MDCYQELKCTAMPEHLSRVPGKNVLHFSDGVLEVDEEDESPPVNKQMPMNPQNLSWAPWMWYYTTFAGSKALQVCDYMGEFLAAFFGITTPKYQYEISEYNRIKREEQESGLGKDVESLERSHSWSGERISTENINKSPHTTLADEFQLQPISIIKEDGKF